MKNPNAKQQQKSIICMILLCIYCSISFSQTEANSSLNYLKCPQVEHTDTIFGHLISDHYNWLNSDYIGPKVSKWIIAQNELAENYLNQDVNQYKIQNTLQYYSNSGTFRFDKLGPYYFTRLSDVGHKSNSLYYTKNIDSEIKKLVNPFLISKTDVISISDFALSNDDKYLSYAYSTNGSELKEIEIITVKNGKKLEDHISNYAAPDLLHNEGMAWRDNGFYYSRYGKPGQPNNNIQYLYYHSIDTPEEQDILIYTQEKTNTSYYNLFVSSNERFFVVIDYNYQTQSTNILYDDFKDTIEGLSILIEDFKSSIKFIDSHDGKLLAITDHKENNKWLVSIDPLEKDNWKALTQQYKNEVLLNASICGSKIIALHQVGGDQHLTTYNLDGQAEFKISIGIGRNVFSMVGNTSNNELLLSIESYIEPPQYYIYNAEEKSISHEKISYLSTNINRSDYEMSLSYAKSEDGTNIPVTIVRHKTKFKQDGNNTTLLNAYGGFGIPYLPSFDPSIIFLLENGGVFAVAHVRGGSELGSNWYEEGKGDKKVNSINDFIAVSEYLIKEKYTSSDKLAISGTSHGGYLIAAAFIKRPELFRVAIPIVGLYDLIGLKYYREEFGSLDVKESFEKRLAISPYHNIKDKIDYPSILMIADKNDGRIPVYQSLKTTALLQEYSTKKNPVLLQISENKGHFTTSSYDAMLSQKTNILSFIFKEMNYKPIAK